MANFVVEFNKSESQYWEVLNIPELQPRVFYTTTLHKNHRTNRRLVCTNFESTFFGKEVSCVSYARWFPAKMLLQKSLCRKIWLHFNLDWEHPTYSPWWNLDWEHTLYSPWWNNCRTKVSHSVSSKSIPKLQPRIFHTPTLHNTIEPKTTEPTTFGSAKICHQCLHRFLAIFHKLEKMEQKTPR